jgi:DNA-binding NarL/FixJ family response regulator
VRVAVADDAVILREGLARLLVEAGFEVVGLASNADELYTLVERSRPDVAIVDIRMPPTLTDEGLQAAKRIRERWPETGILVLSQYLEDRYALELVSGGAQGVGYLLKDRVGDLVVFTDAVRRVAGGGSALDPAVVQRMVDRPRAESPIDELTPREREVLALMAEGRSNQGIADVLVVTVAAVERHVTSIFSKLGLHQAPEDHRRVLAVLTYLRK